MSARGSSYGLPGVLETAAECCGLDTAAALAVSFGGLDVYIPLVDNLDGDHPLSKALGVDAARQLADALGPGRVNVPFGPFSGSAKQRRATIMRLLNEGRTKTAVAKGLGIHERSVYRVAQEMAARDPQPLPLFPDD